MEDKVSYLGISIHRKDPEYITPFSKALLTDFYLKDGESIPEAIARPAVAFCFGDYELAQAIYDDCYNGWAMYSSPVFSNAPKGMWDISTPFDKKAFWEAPVKGARNSYWNGEVPKAMPISCFLMDVPDNIQGQINAGAELASLSVAGGGVGLHNSIRATSKKAPGPIPYMKTVDAAIGYYQQNGTRRGSCAYYMDVGHPDIMEFIKFRVPSGGDSGRKSDNRKQFHNAVNFTDDFKDALREGKDFELKCPHTGEVKEMIDPRKIWEAFIEARSLTGEPYMFKIDTANRSLPSSQKALGLRIKGSNLCNEIDLPTNQERTAVCCLSSINLEYWNESKDTGIVARWVRFLDNVLQSFIDRAPDSLSKAVFSAQKERAIGLGTMGWHYYLQRNEIPFESGGINSAIQHTNIIFSQIQRDAEAESRKLAEERGEPDDMLGSGLRNSRRTAIAPNSNNSIILNTSPAIEPLSQNIFPHSTRAGTYLVKNKYLEKMLEQAIPDPVEREAEWQRILKDDGSSQGSKYLTKEQKELTKTAFEMDQHWIMEQADHRQKHLCMSQSVNAFFAAGITAAYFNSVHLKALFSENQKGMYYARMSREVKAGASQDVERKAIQDWAGDGATCVACEG